MTRALADAGELLADVDSEQAECDLEKVRQLQRMYRWGQQLIDLLSSTSMERLMALVDQFRRD